MIPREFIFIEKSKSEWFYILENMDAPVTAWNWLDYAEANGPFHSFEEAVNCFSCYCDEKPLENTIMINDHFMMLSKNKRQLYNSLMESVL
jgi:hypothetical protein